MPGFMKENTNNLKICYTNLTNLKEQKRENSNDFRTQEEHLVTKICTLRSFQDNWAC